MNQINGQWFQAVRTGWMESASTLAVLLTMLFVNQAVKAQDLESLKQQARALYKQGEYAQAAVTYEKALEVVTRQFGATDQKTDIVANELAMSYYNLARYSDAEPLYQRVLKNHEGRLGPQATEVATCLNNLGALYDSMGDFSRAESVYQRSLAILTAALGPNDPSLATTYNNLGAVSRYMGNSAQSVQLYKKSLELYERQPTRNEVLIANVMNNLAGAYADLGQYDLAEPLYRKALQSREERLGPSHPSVARSLNNLASVLEDLKRFDQVEQLYQRALKIRTDKLGADHPDVAVTLNNLASLYGKLGRLQEAEKLQQQALAIREAKLGKEHPLVAHSLNNMAGLFKDLDRDAQALEMYERCLKIQRQKNGFEHPEVALTFNNIAYLQAKREKWEAAAEAFDQCRRIVRDHVTQVLPALTESEQLTFLQTTDEHYLHGALALAFERREDTSVAERSAAWVLNAKGIAQQAVAQKRILDRDAKDETLKPFVQSLREIRHQLALALRSGSKLTEAERLQQLLQLRAQEKEAAKLLAQKSGRPVHNGQWAEIADVRKALAPKSVLVEIARFRPRNFKARTHDENRWLAPRYAAWIIPAAGEGEVKIVDLGEVTKVDEAVKNARTALVKSGETIRTQGELAAEQQLMATMSELSNIVLNPWLSQTGAANSLVLSPDATLWLIPWAALPLPDKRFAIEKFQLGYVVSGRDLVTFGSPATNLGAPVVLADPDYDLPFKDLLSALQPLFGVNRIPMPINIVRPAATLGKVARLPGTAVEAAAITPKLESYAGKTPQNFNAQYAQETVVKALQRPKALVISTHGFFLPDGERTFGNDESESDKASSSRRAKGDNPLLRCGLLMAGCNSKELVTRVDTDDGVLTGQEILDADLRGTELVVLSACETGLGEVRNGEGVAGLRQAFQLAGARTVMATLWEVPDVQTARLMIKFFTFLGDGKGKSASLREAQMEAIQARRDRYGAAHPFFWAAFTLTGAP